MCRIYGFVATDPTRLECNLIGAQNALQTQSDRDQRGIRNADGWGIAHGTADGLTVARSTDTAFADHDFESAAHTTTSDAVIAWI